MGNVSNSKTRSDELSKVFESISRHEALEEVLTWLRQRNNAADMLEAFAHVERDVKR